MQSVRRIAATALAVAVLITAGWFFVGRDTGGNAGDAKQTQPDLPAIGPDGQEYVKRFNATSKSDPADFELGDPTWVHDDAINLDVASYPIGDWSLIELYRNPAQRIAAIYVVARPAGAAEQKLFLNIATSVIASVLQVERDDASNVLLGGLKADAVTDLDEKVERDGLRFSLTRKAGANQLTVTDAKASAPRR